MWKGLRNFLPSCLEHSGGRWSRWDNRKALKHTGTASACGLRAHTERALGSPLFPLTPSPPAFLEQLNVALSPSPTQGHESYKGLEMQLEPFALFAIPPWAPYLLWAPDYQGAASWPESCTSLETPISISLLLSQHWAHLAAHFPVRKLGSLSSLHKTLKNVSFLFNN